MNLRNLCAVGRTRRCHSDSLGEISSKCANKITSIHHIPHLIYRHQVSKQSYQMMGASSRVSFSLHNNKNK
ncbi:unnamed protein product, partial [Vitis vinifera]